MTVYDSSRRSHGIKHIPLLKDDIDTYDEVVLDAIRYDIDISDMLIQASNTSYNTMLEHYYLTGLRGDYVYRLPTSNIPYYTIEQDVLEAYLTNQVGEPVHNISYNIGVYDLTYMVRYCLYPLSNYDSATHTLHDIFLDDGSFVSSFVIQDSFSRVIDHNHIKITSTTGYSLLIESLIPIKPESVYVNLTYNKATTPELFYHVYESNSAVHTELIDPKAILLNTFFPVVAFRKNARDMLRGDRLNPAYVSSRMLLKRLGFTLEDLQSTINKVPAKANLDHLYFVVALDVLEDNEYINSYLFDYFKHVYESNVNTENVWTSFIQSTNPQYAAIPYNFIDVTDTIYGYRLSYSYISYKQVVGTLPNNATYTKTITKSTPINLKVYSGTSLHSKSPILIEDPSKPSLIIRKQLDNGSYDELIISGLIVQNTMYNTVAPVCTPLCTSIETSFGIPLCVGLFYTRPCKSRLALAKSSLAIIATSYSNAKAPKDFMDKFLGIFKGLWGAIFDLLGSLVKVVIGRFGSLVRLFGLKTLGLSMRDANQSMYAYAIESATLYFLSVYSIIQTPIYSIFGFALSTITNKALKDYNKKIELLEENYQKQVLDIQKIKEQIPENQYNIQNVNRVYNTFLQVGLFPTIDVSITIDTKLNYAQACLDTINVSNFTKDFYTSRMMLL